MTPKPISPVVGVSSARGATFAYALALVVVSGLVLGDAGCSKGEDSALKKPKAAIKLQYPVEVAPLDVRQVQYNVLAPGSIDAFQQVQITSRVSGAVDKVAFVEGQTVQQGDTLVVIEIERFQVAVDQAKAALDKTIAAHKAAQAELARRQGAVAAHPGLVAGEEIEQYETSVASTQADSDSAQQTVRVAQLNLRDAYVRAPFAGVIQSRTVQAGQYLQPGVVLATLLQRDPLLLRFPVTEADAPRVKVGMMANLTLRESSRTYQAKIILVSAAADPTTRLVPVTATVDDTDHKYWLRPGAFCDVNVPIGDARQGIVVPSLSVQPTEQGNVVYVVDPNNIAHQKSVTLGMHTPEGGVEVTQGLTAGELLVVRGFEPLSEGAPVQISQRTTLAAATEDDAGSQAPAASAPSATATDPQDPGAASGEAQASTAPSAGAGGKHKRQAQ
ncbi:MAG TPA: efflux RND transporter periplasmic adaptor subunit [Polyangiaceae bacterium]|nr:efflux RND transporter periplasmic adaptor subunit [Polyangiaceae bacterium]